MQRRLTPIFLLISALTACMVDTPAVETSQAQTAAPTAPAAAIEPIFEPTAAPDVPTAVPPTSVPPTPEPPTPVPQPTATTEPSAPTPLPTSEPDNFDANIIGPGTIAVPVRAATFILDQAHPIVQLGGHTLIYVDSDQNAEVDIFTPLAGRDGVLFADYDAVMSYLASDVAFDQVRELSSVSIAGFPTRVFEGTFETDAALNERAFFTDVADVQNGVLGWFPPARMRLWVINHPGGPVVVSAESLENPGRYSEAVKLATNILSTIDFG